MIKYFLKRLYHSDTRAHIFNAGPAVLPESVLLEVQKDLLNYKGKILIHESNEDDRLWTECS